MAKPFLRSNMFTDFNRLTFDPLIQLARESHRQSRSFSAQSKAQRYRRDQCIRQLAGENPRWSVSILARAIGCPESIVRRALARKDSR